MPDTTQYRYSSLRAAEGRIVQGRLISYNDIARLPWGKERFQAGAFGDVGATDAILNFMHDRKRPLARTGAGLTLTDTDAALDLFAVLPETPAADEALAMVKVGLLRGLSLEFLPTKSRSEAGVTVIEAAKLIGAGLVDKPAYESSKLREKPRRRLWL